MMISARSLPFGAGAFVLAVSLPLSASAQSVPEQLEFALELYEAGEYGAAITELEFAMDDIRSAMSQGIADTFPPAPPGWTAGEATSSGGDGGAALLGMLGGGATLERVYTEDEGEGRIEVSLMIDNPMAQGLGAMLGNPMLASAQPNAERVRVGRESATVTWEADRGQAEATMMVDGRILVRVESSRLASTGPVVQLLQAWDLEALRVQAAR